MKKREKKFNLPGLHFWFGTIKFDKKDIDNYLKKLQDIIEILRKE